MGDPLTLFVQPIVGRVINEATSLLAHEYQLLRGVNEEIRKLKDQLTAIAGVLADAEEKQHNSQQLRDWLGKLQAAAYDAQDILETFATNASARHHKKKVWPLSFARKTAYELDCANKIEELLARLDHVAKEKEKFHLSVHYNPVTYDDRNTDFHVNVSDVVGRDDDRDTIVKMLLSEEYDRAGDVSVIPIVGMGGLGKTTLAQFVYNDARVQSHFPVTMWACVNYVFDHKKILVQMIENYSKMEHDINMLSVSQIKSRLLEYIKNRRFLLVLDDVWTETNEQWETILSLLRQGDKGSRVLVTCRTTGVSDVMGTHPPYRLGYLPEDKCWSLFEKIAFVESNCVESVRRDLKEIGVEIVRKCDGLPLAVKAMAGILRGNNDVTKWQTIRDNEIWETETSNITYARPTILPALKLSYNQLPSYLKQCFAYCYIFPKSYVFRKMELIKLWKAVSLIQPRGEDTIPTDTSDEIGSDYFDNLLSRSFFQLVKVGKDDTRVLYSMHDLIHDLAQSLSKPHCYQVKDKESCHHIDEETRHVSLLCKDVEQPILEIIKLNPKKLRTLVSPTEYLKDFGQVFDKLLCALRCIRVLDLSSSTILELPKSVGELKLLRYLDLSKTEIRMLPNSICNLYNLQTLKLLGCLWLFELPKDLGELVNLQHLELDDMFWHKLQRLPPKMGKLKSLQNLHAFRVCREEGYGIEELRDMMHLTDTLRILKLEDAVNAGEAKLKEKKALKNVVFEWSTNRDGGPQVDEIDERILEDLQPHSDLIELQIFNYRGAIFPSWLRNRAVLNLVKITLNYCTKCRLLSLGDLPCLRQLNIKGLLELEEWSEAQHNSLQRLTISKCPKLKELPLPFWNLNVLKIKKCDSLKVLPLTPSLQFLTLDDNSVLEDWNETGLILQSFDDQGQLVLKRVPSFLELLELRINDCPRLDSLPRIFAPQKLEISACPLLTTLPIPDFAQRLQHLALDACPDGTLVKKIPEANKLYSLVISKIPSLESLPILPHLRGLKALYIHQCEDLVYLAQEEASFCGLVSLNLLSIKGCTKLVRLPHKGLPVALEYLSIGSCTSLESLGPKEMLKNLTSLKDLCIEDCPALRSLPEEGLPTSLQHLHIEGCPLLTTQCQKNSGPYWDKIMHIPDLVFESTEVSSEPNSQPTKKASWYTCCKGIAIRETGQPQGQ